ncbi:hTAFII28-like protein conserved region-domain-containing protein [Morchella snyderi]|nr:hTAFII28-like protein conserved region-domain-containing protein [Morchella snyderi]
MSSPPASSPPSTTPSTSHKRRISLPPPGPPTSSKKPKLPTRKNSTLHTPTVNKHLHPLRQTSFPPESEIDRRRSPSVLAGTGGAASQTANNNNDEDEDDGRDDYGTTTVLADGSAGGFAEDDAEKRKLAILLDSFDADQNRRYEAFRRSNLNKAAVKKLANQVLSQSVTANVGTVICGFSKVFTGEIIELALQIQRQWGDQGPLLPDHLREAARRYRVEMAGSVGFRGAVGGGSPSAAGAGPGAGGDGPGAGVGRLFR